MKKCYDVRYKIKFWTLLWNVSGSLYFVVFSCHNKSILLYSSKKKEFILKIQDSLLRLWDITNNTNFSFWVPEILFLPPVRDEVLLQQDWSTGPLSVTLEHSFKEREREMQDCFFLITPFSSLWGPESCLLFLKPDFAAQCCDELKISVTLIFLFFFQLTKLLSPCECEEFYLVLHHEVHAVQSAILSLAELDWEEYIDRQDQRHKSLHNWDFGVDWITGIRPNTAPISLWLFVCLQGSSAWPT